MFLVKAYRFLLCLQDIFILCVIQSFLSFILLYLIGKQASKMLKKVQRNYLNIRVDLYLHKQIPSFLLK